MRGGGGSSRTGVRWTFANVTPAALSAGGQAPDACGGGWGLHTPPSGGFHPLRGWCKPGSKHTNLNVLASLGLPKPRGRQSYPGEIPWHYQYNFYIIMSSSNCCWISTKGKGGEGFAPLSSFQEECPKVKLWVLISLAPPVRFARNSKLSWGIYISCHMQRGVAIHAFGEKL